MLSKRQRYALKHSRGRVSLGGLLRNVARIKLGYYPLPPAEGVRLRSLLKFAPGASALDPCAGTGATLHQLTARAEVEKHAVELDAERASVAAASGIATGANPKITGQMG